MRKAWVVQTQKGDYIGIRRYSYKDGTYRPLVSFDHARVFHRRVDADNARERGDTVVEVTIAIA